MKKKAPKPLNIKDYTKNAAKNFSMTRLIIYTAFSLLLTVLLLVTTIQYGYTGKALMFTLIALLAIAAYTVLNVIALITKIRNSK